MAATSRFIDVSSFQGAQDWASLAAGGLTGAQVKASEGEHTHDARYRMHMDGVLAVASLMPQAYHYAWPNQDAKTEADNYLSVVSGDADKHPAFVHWLDLERRSDGANYSGRSAAQIRAYAEAWVDRVRAAHPHQRVGCYTSGSDVAAGHYPRNSDALWYPAYPSGAMSYTQAEQRGRPAPSGVKALFWQFTSTPLDRSIAYMTPAALRTWAGGDTDMPLTDADVQKICKALLAYDAVPASRVLPNSDFETNPTWSVGYTLQTAVESARSAQQAAQQAVAQGAGLSAAVAALAHDGGITAEQVQAAAEAGAAAALAQLGTTLAEQTPAAAG
jgi:GH25 family lysozyme M1 (1,4-beta-N-acetylmuramidase)